MIVLVYSNNTHGILNYLCISYRKLFSHNITEDGNIIQNSFGFAHDDDCKAKDDLASIVKQMVMGEMNKGGITDKCAGNYCSWYMQKVGGSKDPHLKTFCLQVLMTRFIIFTC